MNSGFLICVRQCCWSATSGTSGFRVVPMDGKADEKRQNIENLGYTEGEESKSDGYKNFTD